jgi:hypothetical protein
VLLKYFTRNADKTIEVLLTGGTYMGDKHDNKNKKKLTKKEIKAQNHAKLMANKGQPSNVVDLNAYKDQNKKAA